MLRKSFPILVIAAIATAGCADRDAGDEVLTDTTMQIVPDTVGIERTITEDTIRDFDRDTLPGDTARRDTLPQ